ncbi:arabinogalactan oligomer / maltooligosaccharide transport system substrate-binding protein [Fontibacillus panacisegetis]|uniref:Maltodextrin-binding protein n=1 Tax=Fontibacillus panacisegetis TaxID=670482 RepID=A0A1G7N5N5_9BACL|nr:maltose ABC transporter substrate-binding protein [Fontibacillus panacisegetis]SDF69395.1 arabinogalactan oligomer / maltooligosaccharide transport system substrate-binding protein [Fontibacillus panacisegetis]
MKKMMSLVVALAALLAIVACSNDKTEPAGTAIQTENSTDSEVLQEPGAELLVWASKEELPFINEISKQFTEKYGVPVMIQEVGASDTLGKLTTDGPAQIGADLVTFTHDQLGKAVSAGLVLPNDAWQEDTRKTNKDNVIQAVTYGNIMYGYPLSLESNVLFYNKQLVPEPPASFEEVVEFAKGFNDPGKSQFALMWEIENFYFNYMFIASDGGYVFGNNGVNFNDIGLNNEGAVKGVAYYGTLKDKLLPMRTGDVTYDVKKGLFLGGQLAMNIDGPWLIHELREQKDRFGAAPLPSINGKPAVSFFGVKSLYVNAYTKYPNAAKLFAHFASDKEAQLLNFQLTGAAPSHSELMTDPNVQKDEFVSAITKQFEHSQPMPSIQQMSSVWIPIAAAMADVWNNGTDAKTALDHAVGQIKDSISGGSSGGGL